MTGARSRIARLAVAAAIVLPAVLGSFSTSQAAPSKAQVDAAKAKLDALNHQLEILAERFNTAQVVFQQDQAKRDAAQRQMEAAKASAQAAQAQLAAREKAAFTGQGAQLNTLLGSQSFADFSDRLAFMGAMASNDADLATQYQAATRQAQAAQLEYQAAVDDQQKQLDTISTAKSQAADAAQQQQQQYSQIYGSYQKAQAALRAAAQAAAQAPPPSGSGGSTGGFVPPPNASAAQIAIAAAQSVIGTQYVWGAADPSVGFDCSGLVMWAYAHAGISLPHSSTMMAAMLPHVTYSELQPGDLVFFYSPVSHVGLYIGGGQMIDAAHSGPGGEVNIRSIASFGAFDYGGRISG
jgi:cell wall-associated NlpC family hydrolase